MTHEHLHDEQLSAHLDGEREASSPEMSDEAFEAQVAGCATCRERLAALGQAQALMGRGVVPVAPSVRAAAVEEALAEGLADDGAHGPGGQTPVLAMPPRPARPRGLMAAAAAVAVLVVGVGAAVGVSHSNSPSAKAASGAATSRRPASHSSLTPTAASPAASLPDLGPLSSEDTVRSRIATVLPPGSKASYGTENGSLSAGESSPSENSATAATESTAAGGFSDLGSVPAAFAPCLTAAERTVVTTDTLDLVATATYRSTPALVVVVTVPPSAPSTASRQFALIVSRSGCQILARVSL